MARAWQAWGAKTRQTWGLAQEAGMARLGLTDDKLARVPLFKGLSKRQLSSRIMAAMARRLAELDSESNL